VASVVSSSWARTIRSDLDAIFCLWDERTRKWKESKLQVSQNFQMDGCFSWRIAEAEGVKRMGVSGFWRVPRHVLVLFQQPTTPKWWDV